MIELKLYATLQPYAPSNASNYPVTAGTTIEKIIEELNIPINQVKLIFLNGVKCGLETYVKDGDRIGLFPPVGGG